MSEGYAFLMEATHRVREGGLRVVEVPLTFTDRHQGKPKISRKVLLESIWCLVACGSRWARSRKRTRSIGCLMRVRLNKIMSGTKSDFSCVQFFGKR